MTGRYTDAELDAGVISYKRNDSDVSNGLCYRRATPHEGIKAGFGLSDIAHAKRLHAFVSSVSNDTAIADRICLHEPSVVLDDISRKLALLSRTSSAYDNVNERRRARIKRFRRTINDLDRTAHDVLFEDDFDIRRFMSSRRYFYGAVDKMLTLVSILRDNCGGDDDAQWPRDRPNVKRIAFEISGLLRSKWYKNCKLIMESLNEHWHRFRGGGGGD